MCPESLEAADEVITALLKSGLDYSSHRLGIAETLFDNGIFEGNSDVTLEVVGMPSLRAIQEDEYDQHMEDDQDKPEYDDQACYSAYACAYIWVIK